MLRIHRWFGGVVFIWLLLLSVTGGILHFKGFYFETVYPLREFKPAYLTSEKWKELLKKSEYKKIDFPRQESPIWVFTKKDGQHRVLNPIDMTGLNSAQLRFMLWVKRLHKTLLLREMGKKIHIVLLCLFSIFIVSGIVWGMKTRFRTSHSLLGLFWIFPISLLMITSVGLLFHWGSYKQHRPSQEISWKELTQFNISRIDFKKTHTKIRYIKEDDIHPIGTGVIEYRDGQLKLLNENPTFWKASLFALHSGWGWDSLGFFEIYILSILLGLIGLSGMFKRTFIRIKAHIYHVFPNPGSLSSSKSGR